MGRVVDVLFGRAKPHERLCEILCEANASKFSFTGRETIPRKKKKKKKKKAVNLGK